MFLLVQYLRKSSLDQGARRGPGKLPFIFVVEENQNREEENEAAEP
jgi:hypothetical protein